MFGRLLNKAREATQQVTRTVEAVAEHKLSARDALMLVEFKQITNIADRAGSIRTRLSAFSQARDEAERLFNSINVSSPLQLIAKMAQLSSFVTDLKTLGHKVVQLLPEITNIQADCKALLKELEIILADINDPKRALEKAPGELVALAKEFAQEILAGNAQKISEHYHRVKATVDELDRLAKDLKDKTNVLQKGHDALNVLFAAENDKSKLATTFISSAGPSQSQPSVVMDAARLAFDFKP